MVFYSDGLAKQGHFGQLNCIRVQSMLDKNTVNSCSCGIKLFTVSALGRIISTQMMFREKNVARVWGLRCNWLLRAIKRNCNHMD